MLSLTGQETKSIDYFGLEGITATNGIETKFLQSIGDNKIYAIDVLSFTQIYECR